MERLLATWRATWWNFRTQLVTRILRFLQVHPRCPCGWMIAQQFTGPWVCGACIKAGRGYLGSFPFEEAP